MNYKLITPISLKELHFGASSMAKGKALGQNKMMV
jgi:hypothetical protein